jgi:hypothetical protein
LKFESNRSGNVEGNCEIESAYDDFVLLHITEGNCIDIISVPFSKLVIIYRVISESPFTEGGTRLLMSNSRQFLHSAVRFSVKRRKLKIDANRFIGKTVCFCFKQWRFTKAQITMVVSIKSIRKNKDRA